MSCMGHGNKQSLLQCKKMGNTVQRTIHGEPLEAVDHHKYLGVELSSDLNCWNYRQSQQISWLYKKKLK